MDAEIQKRDLLGPGVGYCLCVLVYLNFVGGFSLNFLLLIFLQLCGK